MSDSSKNRFGEYLRSCRLLSGHSLREVAQHMNWSSAYLSDIERGNRKPPNPLKLRQMAAFIGALEEEK